MRLSIKKKNLKGGIRASFIEKTTIKFRYFIKLETWRILVVFIFG
jgi:hypothetical protein